MKFYTLQRCKASAARFETRTSWAKGDRGAYDAAYRNKWIEECCGHMRYEWRRRSLDECKRIAQAYPTRWAWERGDEASYAAARRNGWTVECCAHMKDLSPEEKAMLATATPVPAYVWKNQLPPPKNGRWPIVMLVGGPADIFRETKAKWEGGKGIELKYHWDYERARDFDGAIPKDVDLVVMFKDFIGHANSSKAKAAAKRAGVRFLCTTSKRSAWEHAFYKLGLKNAAALPTNKETPAQTLAIPPIIRRAKPAEAPVVPTQVEKEHHEALFPALASKPAPAPELPKRIELAPPPALLEPKPLPARVTPTVNIVVAQQAIPVSAMPQRRPGIPRPETAAMIAALQAMCAEDEISVIIEPAGFQVSAVKS
jgi:hypothetical protein